MVTQLYFSVTGAFLQFVTPGVVPLTSNTIQQILSYVADRGAWRDGYVTGGGIGETGRSVVSLCDYGCKWGYGDIRVGVSDRYFETHFGRTAHDMHRGERSIT